MQEALIAATEQWPKFGVPENPQAWLITVASRRLTDQLRSESARRRREAHAFSQEPADARVVPPPDAGNRPSATIRSRCSSAAATLALLIVCHRPDVARRGGLTTAEIARAFLVPEATMAQRISRAKQTIKASGVPFGHPG